jgi:hypothetical protein
MQCFGGLAKNRTWIWSFGNSYTIHCTTRPKRTIVILVWSFVPNYVGDYTIPVRQISSGRALYYEANSGLFYQTRCIGGKYFYRNGEQYYAKKFSYRY